MPTVRSSILVVAACFFALAPIPAPAASPPDQVPASVAGNIPKRTAQHKAHHLRVVVWNIQRGANNFNDGPEKALAIIQAIDADLCLLQESYDIEDDRPTLGRWMAETLNAQTQDNWTAWQGQSPHLCLLTRLHVDQTHFHEPWHGLGATLRDDQGRSLIAWSIWLDWRDYLPYALRDHPDRTDQELLASESVGSSRLPQAQALLAALRDAGHLTAQVPVLVGGDFNCPSHLDWTQDTSLVYRFRRPLQLPVSLAFHQAGFTDAFRTVFPEPVQHPGITWTPLYRGSSEAPGTAERIDRLYVHQNASVLRPVAAWTLPHVYEPAEIPQALRAFPSDHAAVVIDLHWSDQHAQQPAEPEPFFTQAPPWRPIFQGIDHAELATDKPRDLVVQAMRIDTAAPGLEIVTTPANGERPLETDGQTTRAFLEEHDLSVAINTHFFDPCCNRLPGEAKDLIGLAIAEGKLVSPHADPAQRDVILMGLDLLEDKPGLDVVMFPAAPDVHEINGVQWLEGVSHAIAGRAVLSGGQIKPGQDDFATTLHPRTLVGYSNSAQYLYLVTIDGRQPGYSTGASLKEAAAIMRHLGAWHAINVDGGGSTTMVLKDPDGASQLVNSPSSQAERIVGGTLGPRARPLKPANASTP